LDGKKGDFLDTHDKRFVKNTKQAPSLRAKGRKVVEAGDAYQL